MMTSRITEGWARVGQARSYHYWRIGVGEGEPLCGAKFIGLPYYLIDRPPDVKRIGGYPACRKCVAVLEAECWQKSTSERIGGSDER